jgi:hypothetical protein
MAYISANSGTFWPGLQPHVRLLPVRTVAGETSAAPQFAFEIRRAHFFHFHLEKLLDRLASPDLVGVRATSKHSVRSSSFLVTPFSVTSGRLITS